MSADATVPASAILSVLKDYFDALYEGDADKFARVLHPAARLFCATGETTVIMDVPEYLAIVRGRESPASRGDRRRDEVVSLEIPTPTTAHARVQELFLPKRFTDELTLILTNGEWKIVSKVWHFELECSDA